MKFHEVFRRRLWPIVVLLYVKVLCMRVNFQVQFELYNSLSMKAIKTIIVINLLTDYLYKLSTYFNRCFFHQYFALTSLASIENERRK